MKPLIKCIFLGDLSCGLTSLILVESTTIFSGDGGFESEICSSNCSLIDPLSGFDSLEAGSQLGIYIYIFATTDFTPCGAVTRDVFFLNFNCLDRNGINWVCPSVGDTLFRPDAPIFGARREVVMIFTTVFYWTRRFWQGFPLGRNMK